VKVGTIAAVVVASSPTEVTFTVPPVAIPGETTLIAPPRGFRDLSLEP
jgi:hypothetical protein